MKKLSELLLLLISLAVVAPVSALVNPDLTQQQVPGWMVDINVVVTRENRIAQLCRGVLIAPQWVLSATTCLYDPNRLLDDEQGETQYIVKLGPNEDGVEAEFFQSDDGTVALLHLDLASEAQPLPLGEQAPDQLRGKEAFIFGKQTSLAVKHAVYNPSVLAPAATCTVNGTSFSIDGAICYLLTKPHSSFTLYRTRARIIDPLSGPAPFTALDRAVKIDTSGKQLYLDFRESSSYPCHEDIGAPVLVANDGGYEIAGVVVGVGMTALLPVCGMSMANIFISITHARKFIDETIARYDFGARCPLKPEAEIFYLAGSEVSLAWNPVKGATGYKVHYTTQHGHVPITTIDVGTRTAIYPALEPGIDYLVAVTAYNAACSSELSDPLPVNLADKKAL